MRKRIITLLLACLMLFSLSSFALATDTDSAETAEAEVARASLYLTSYVATASSSGGDITIGFIVNGTGIMDSIGAIEIAIYNNTTGTLATRFYARNNPTMLASGKMTYSSSVTYENAIVGDEYYAIVQCYAEEDGGSDTKPYTTNFVICKI